MRYIFITGVSRGLGAALAKICGSQENTQLIGFSRQRGEFSGDFHSCDLTKPQLLQSILDSAFEGIDFSQATEAIFINNAGKLGPLTFIERLDAFDIQENISANLISSALFLSLFIKYTADLDIPKAFVNISSGAALADRAKPGWSLYCASKAAQEQLIRTVALEQEHARHPCKIFNFNPGVMETSMQQLIRSTPKEHNPEVERFIELHRKGEVADPADVAVRLAKALNNLSTLKSGYTYQHSDFQ